ncbi:MAG: hypothetical protein ACYDDI_15510 [Candidatus Acidiferrales bacterium]
MAITIRKIRDSEAWRTTGDISVLHWLITSAASAAAAIITHLRGVPVQYVILLFAGVFALFTAGWYFWEKRKQLKPQAIQASNHSAKSAKSKYLKYLIPAVAVLLVTVVSMLPKKTAERSIQSISSQPSTRQKPVSPTTHAKANTHAKKAALPSRPPQRSRSVPRTSTTPQMQINAPYGIAIGGGNVTNPTVINTGPPPAKLTFTEEVVTPLSQNGQGEEQLRVNIRTDRPIVGPVIGIVFSGPFTIDPHKPFGLVLGAPISQFGGGGQLARGNSPVPNSLWFSLNEPSVFLPTQEIILWVQSKSDIHVIEVVPVMPNPASSP